jgi:hypothetical protein
MKIISKAFKYPLQMKFYLTVISFVSFIAQSIAGSSNLIQFKIKEHSKDADTIRMFLNTVHDFYITDSVALVYYKDNHSDTYTIVSEGENRMFYIVNGGNSYYVKYTTAFRDVQFILDNSESRVDATVILFDQLQFDCNGSVSSCKASDMLCIENKRKGGCIQR